MSDDDSQVSAETVNLPIDDDDAPTERISLEKLSKTKTDPTHAGVLSSEIAANIRAEHAKTVSEDDNITFVGIVDEAGRILVPEEVRRSGAVQPGFELLIRAIKIT